MRLPNVHATWRAYTPRSPKCTDGLTCGREIAVAPKEDGRHPAYTAGGNSSLTTSNSPIGHTPSRCCCHSLSFAGLKPPMRMQTSRLTAIANCVSSSFTRSLSAQIAFGVFVCAPLRHTRRSRVNSLSVQENGYPAFRCSPSGSPTYCDNGVDQKIKLLMIMIAIAGTYPDATESANAVVPRGAAAAIIPVITLFITPSRYH